MTNVGQDMSGSDVSEGFEVNDMVRIIAEPLEGPFKITEIGSAAFKDKLEESGKQWYHERELELAK